MCKGLWDGPYGLSSLSEKTRESSRLQILLQRQHFLLSYLKTLSVGPAGVWTRDLPNFLFQNMQDIDLSTDSLGSGMELSSAIDNILPLEDGSPQLV